MKVHLTFVLFILNTIFVDSATVLFFLLGSNAYDRHIFEFLAQQVALRHHNTVTIKPILVPEEPRLVKPRLHLVREKIIKNLLPKEIYEPLEEVGGDVPWRKTYELDAYSEPYWKAHNHSCEKLLNSNLMETIKRDQVEVAIVYSGNPCQLAFVHALGIPFIYFDLEGFTDETIIASGTPWNLNSLSSRSTPQTQFSNGLIQQLFNGAQLIRESLCQGGWSFLGKILCKRVQLLDEPISRLFIEDYEIKKRFKPFPSVNWIKQNAELYFLNTDPLIESYHSLPSHVIPIGGTHIDHPRPLFAPWNTSVGHGQSGIILVQMGANVDSSKMPAHLVKAFLGAFSRLKKYRIFWRIGTNLKLKDIDLESVPSHINITTYLPQNDLLANKKTKLLITSGGMSSLMESIHHGVPMLGIPLYGNNYQNLMKIQQKGLGKTLDRNAITESTLYSAIKNILENPKFERTSQEAAKDIRERPYSQFDLVLNSIEHVARHRSAKFIRSNDKPKGLMLFLRVTNLDFFAIFAAILLLISFISYTILRLFLKCLTPFGKKPSKETLKNKNLKKNQ